MSIFENSDTENKQGNTATLEAPFMYDEQSRPTPSPKVTSTDILLLAGGVALPVFATMITALNSLNMAAEMLLRHPLETLAQYALVACVPIGNYLIWNRLRQQNFANLIRIGIFNGISVGTSACILAVCIAASIMGTQSENGLFIEHSSVPTSCGAVATLSLITSIYLLLKLRQSWATRGAKKRQLVFSLVGIFLSLIAIGASEARQTAVKLAERATATDEPVQRTGAMNVLHNSLLDAGKELRQDILDPRSGGLSGMLFGIDPTSTRQLYFSLTGTPYQSISDITTNDGSGESTLSANYEQYLADQIIGEVVPGMSLKRSQIRGGVNSGTLTANLEWTFVIKNKSASNTEARAEIALPPGAVVSKLTLWQDGRPTESRIYGENSSTNEHSRVTNPASIRYIGKGRVLLRCLPAEHGNESKVSVTIVAPLKLDSANQASLTLPRLMASNFSTSINHDLHLLSNTDLNFSAADLRLTTSANKSKLYVGTIKATEAKNAGLSLIAARSSEANTISSRNTFSKGYTVQTIQKVPNNVPRSLVVVVDGSKSLKESKNEIADLLNKVQKLTQTTVLLADSDSTEAPDTLSVDAAIKQLNATTFNGGHDNLPAVVKAGELAGQRGDSAVLWIHGPQPALNEEIYITSQSASKTSFYDLAIDDGWTNTSAFLKNHQDIGPMIPVARTGKLRDDINRFISQWQEGGHHYSVQISTQFFKPESAEIDGQDALDLSILGAVHDCKYLLAANQKAEATRVAAAAHIVTPVTTGAVPPTGNVQMAVMAVGSNVVEKSASNAQIALTNVPPTPASTKANNDSLSDFSNASTPTSVESEETELQSATSSTVGAQGRDATYITGINTAGTVRVNILSNIEALLNIIANLIETTGIVSGGILITNGCRKGYKAKLLFFGTAAILIGILCPGIVNWLVASARDANLFS